MQWTCRLYGHAWHHAEEAPLRVGEHVAVPYVCTACGNEREFDMRAGRWLG